MIPVEAWQAFGGVVAVVILLGGGALALQRLGILRSKSAPAPAKGGPPDGLASRVTALETRAAALEEHVATLKERTRKHERSLEGLGNIHRRIDGLTETSGRIEGEVRQMNRQLGLVLNHLLGERAS